MKQMIWVLVGMIASVGALQAQPDLPHVQAATRWLEIIDRGDYAKSWEGTSQGFKEEVSEKQWVNVLNQNRKPLGEIKERNFGGENSIRDPQELPPGHYALVIFTTTFEDHNTPLIETIGLIEEEGDWRGYSFVMEEGPPMEPKMEPKEE